MKVGIHVHVRGEVAPFSQKYITILKHNNINYEILDINNLDFWEKLQECTHFLFNWGGFPDHHQIARSIMPIIEKELKMPCFPNTRTTWHHDDKIRQYYLLKAHGFPIIDSWIFWGKPLALKWLKEEAQYPLVFKLKSSAGSKDVALVKNYFHAKKITKKIFGSGIFLGHIPGNFTIKIKDFKWSRFIDKQLKSLYRIYKGRDINYQWQKEKNYVLFQKFLLNNDFDTRVTIIGNRAFAFRRLNRKDDFRSSGSGKINYEMDRINTKFVELAFAVSREMGFESMAYDFLWDIDKPAFCEMSYTYQDLAIFNCSGFWDSSLNWHDGHNWPQYFHLVDLLNLPDLKQPVFEK